MVQNPWESRELTEKYHKGDIVKIKCLSRRYNHWFGEINGLDDIQVFVKYPSQRHYFPIVPGMDYMGTIYYINAKERSLKARVFQALSDLYIGYTISLYKYTIPKVVATTVKVVAFGFLGYQIYKYLKNK